MSFTSSAIVPNPWVRILDALEKKINRHSYDTWLKPTRYSHATNKILFVRIPTAEFHHVGDKYADLIQEALDNLGLGYEDVKFVTAEDDPSNTPTRHDGGFSAHSSSAGLNTASAPQAAPSGLHPTQGRFDWDSAAQLNPRYTFDAFVIGSGNQFAHAACQAVAERPSKAYNPLFLYGGTGMGKTHLMQAIGHEIKRRTPQSAICYVSSEKFTNEMINSLRYDKMISFRDKFRTMDVLLIDDIHPPDLETKVAILQKKAEQERVTLPVDVALFIASNIRSNVRELEGALIRLVAHSSLIGATITLPYTQQVLKNFIDSQARKVTIESIQKAVAEQFGLRLVEIKSKNNSRSIVYPRQIAMYLAKHLTEASLPEIGRQFGGKHHTTVLHSVEKIDTVRKSDKDLNRLLNKMTEQLGA